MKRLLLIPFLLLTGCSSDSSQQTYEAGYSSGKEDTKPDNWTMFYYPDANDREFFTKLSGLVDLESCQDFGVYIGTENGIVGLVDGTYECGKNCKFNLTLDEFICEETVKN